MRELKFRAWTRQTPSMAWSQRAVAITGVGEQIVPIGGTYTGVWHINDDGLIIEQYTGLKDKNGKEIYEGDIVDVWIGGCKQNTPYIVEDMRELYSEFHHDDGYYQFSEVKIIGNIHENPELCGEEEE